jgi:hypothetical protein
VPTTTYSANLLYNIANVSVFENKMFADQIHSMKKEWKREKR